MRGALAALLLLLARPVAGAPPRAEDFATSAAARSSKWFRAFNSTFNDVLAQRYASLGPWSVGVANASSIGPDWRLLGSPARPLQAVVFYPCAAARCNAVAANPQDSAGRWPAVVFGIGWSSWVLRYERTLRHLASHGFVVLAPTTADNQAAPHAWQYAQTLLASLQFAASESARPGSMLWSRVDVSRAGALGHSMGAGSAAVAAALGSDPSYAASFDKPPPGWPWGSAALLDLSAAPWPSITALVALGIAPITAPLAALTSLRARTLFLLSDADGYIAPASQRALFAALPAAAPRTMAVLRGGSHCWVDEPARQGAGWGLPTSQCELASLDGANFIAPQAQVYVSRKYIAAFFSAALAGDAGAAALVRAMSSDPLLAQLVAEGAQE